MKRFLQVPCIWSWCLGVGAVAALFLASPNTSVSGQSGASLPVVEKVKHEGYTEKVADKVNFKMVPIPGGTYLVGSPAGEKGRLPDEGPQHPVTVKPFWMAECEATWDEFDYFWSKRRGARRRVRTSPRNPRN